MKGEEKLWRILQDKLETLRAGGRLAEAMRIGETALELAQRAFPGNDPAIALSYERLGQMYDQRGERAEAKASLAQALRIVENIEPPDRRAIYRIARRLALISDVAGAEEEAINYYEKAIRAGGELENVLHTDLGTLLNNVALIYRRSGRQKAAEPYYRHALELYEKQLGPNHPDVAAVLNNLGVFYTNERRFEEAEQMHQRALAIRQANPKGLSDIAQSHCNLAVVYHARGDLARAGELYRESLRGWEDVEQPPADYEIVASNYADLLRSLGKKRKAATIEARVRKRRL